MKQKLFDRDIDECWNKIRNLLYEYKCDIIYDLEAAKVCIIDEDTTDCIWFINKNNVKHNK